jgi:chromosome segregation ATPase
VLYLAEVQKQSKSFIGGIKTELKLLAFQRNDQNWAAVPSEETIAAEEANNFNAGVLVLVDLGVNRQVQRPPETAGRQLASILQNFTRLLEKSKNQEEEIEQWRQSLTYQSQELHRREMEIEAQLEQMQQVESEFERLEQQRQEIDRQLQELDRSWERLQEQQARQSGGLDKEQSFGIQELVNRLASAIAPSDLLTEQLNLTWEMFDRQQAAVDEQWRKLEPQKALSQQMQAEVSSETESLKNLKQEWQQAQTFLEQAQTELKVQQKALEVKQESLQVLSLQFQSQEDTYQQIYSLATGSDYVDLSQKIDLPALIQSLESMQIEELQQTVKHLETDLERVKSFVNAQEEELNMQLQAIEELKDKIEAANEFDRMSLDAELGEEQDRYEMLDETLVGQRRNLREREEILKYHLQVFNRRQGIASQDGDRQGELQLILRQMDGQKHQLQSEIQRLESQIEQMRSTIQQTRSVVDRQASEHQNKQKDWQTREQQLLDSKAALAELLSQVNLYENSLQPQQDFLNHLREKLEAIAEFCHGIKDSSDAQFKAVGEIQQVLNSLMAESPHQVTNY